MLPPCQQPLQLHCKRSNYVAKVWRSYLEAEIHFADIRQSGWSSDAKITWILDTFPEQVELILTGEDDSDTDTDSENEYDLCSSEDSHDD